MTRPTLLVVVKPCDEGLLHLAGTMVRYAWQGVRTVLVVLDDGNGESRVVMSRAASLLGVEQTFHSQTDGRVALRLARTVRAFQPQAIIASASTVVSCREARHIATDKQVPMPGLTVLDGTTSPIWVPKGTFASIPVPLTSGIRHAIACLFVEGQYTVAEMRRIVAEREWAETETFTRDGGDAPPSPILDLLAVKDL